MTALRDLLQRLLRHAFGCHTKAELATKIAAVDAKADRIQAQLNRMQKVFDEWAAFKQEPQP